MGLTDDPRTGARGALPFRGDQPPTGAQVFEGSNKHDVSAPAPAPKLRKGERRSSNDGTLNIPQRIG